MHTQRQQRLKIPYGFVGFLGIIACGIGGCGVILSLIFLICYKGA